MYPLKYSILVLFLVAFVHADSAVQTDWSGGDGIPGPVWEWSNDFYQSSCINWSDYSSSLLLSQGILEYTVEVDFNCASSVYSEDINGDGNMDILGAAQDADDITWWDLNGYSSAGTLESSIFEIGWPVDYSIEWGAISWLGTEPSNTELAFLVRASDDPGNMGSVV